MAFGIISVNIQTFVPLCEVTPAMAAGIADHPWEIAELLA
jgi:hypothetical protein